MARYIDADKLINKMFPIGLVDNGKYTINAKAIKVAIDQTPTADVVPKSEVERLEKEVEQLRNNNDCLIKEAVFAPMERAHTIIAVRQEVAREIFEEIEPWLNDYRNNFCSGLQFITFLAELKKKYTEKNDGQK